MKTIILICLFYFLLLSSANAQIVGHEYSDNNNRICDYNSLWFCAPEAASNWKSFRAKAPQGGFVNQFKLFVVSPGADNVTVGWGIYEDDSGEVGALKVGGYGIYDIVTGDNIFPASIVRDNQILRNEYYWITFHSSLGRTLRVQRGREALCSGALKRGTNQGNWTSLEPPPPEEFNVVYNNGCYAWAGVIESDTDLVAEECYCPCCGQKVPCEE